MGRFTLLVVVLIALFLSGMTFASNFAFQSTDVDFATTDLEVPFDPTSGEDIEVENDYEEEGDFFTALYLLNSSNKKVAHSKYSPVLCQIYDSLWKPPQA